MRVSGAISIPRANYLHEMMCIPEYYLNIKLSTRLSYDVSLDQSSTCTGIAIVSVDNNIRIILDCMRDTGDRDEFYRELYRVLKKIVHGQKIRHIICENPPPVQGQKYSSRLLLELLGRISAWVEEIPELRAAEFGKIFPQSWKPFIINKEKGKGRDKVKALIAEDICDILPEFNTYRERHVSKDYDGFDAMGILLGYRAYTYDIDGNRKIAGIQERRHTSFVGYRYVPTDELKSVGATAFLGLAHNQVEPVFLTYNGNYNKFNNIRMASSNNVACYTILDDSFLDELRWQYDLEPQPNHVLLMYVFNESRLAKSLIKVLKVLLPMHEEVQDV